MRRSTLALLTVSAAAFIALVAGPPATPGSVDYVAAPTSSTVPRIGDCNEWADRTDVPGTVPGVCGLTSTGDQWDTIDTADHGTDIPRCASDDYNADHAPRCFTQRVTDGAVILLDADDQVIATLTA